MAVRHDVCGTLLVHPNANHVGMFVPPSARRRSAIAATIKANWNAFDMMAQYVSSINRFSPLDMSFNVAPAIPAVAARIGARPTAWMIGPWLYLHHDEQ